MPRLRGTRRIQAGVLCLFVAVLAYARSTGPDRGYTGAPSDIGDCSACHDTFHQANVGPGSVSITGNPTIYEPGETYTLSITVQDPNRKRWGFQLTAVDSHGLRAGKFIPLGSDTQIAQTGIGAFDRQYIEHSESGTFPGTKGGHTWDIQWTAPSADVGSVQFYAAANAANSDGTNQGDYIYTTSAISESSSTSVTLTLVGKPDGLTLTPGSVFPISWMATNTSNIDSLEVRFSVDDGMTFPIGNLIFSTPDTSITSTDWIVPDISTTLARLRIQVSTKLGGAVEVKSGRFTIGSATPLPNQPIITSVQISGKNLLVSGENFQKGAVVQLAGNNIPTINLKDFSHQLKCKKAATLIPAGSTVPIVVTNPDGGISNPFLLTR